MIKSKITESIVKTMGNTAIGTVLLVYFLFSGYIIILVDIEAKITCDRLEPNYVICEQDELRLDRLLRQEKSSFRLINSIIKNQENGSIISIRKNEDKKVWKSGIYDLYLKTNVKNIFIRRHAYLPYANKEAEEIKKYIQGNLIISPSLNNNIFTLYINNPDFKTNLFIFAIGWILLLIIVNPILKAVNNFTVN